MEGVGHIPRRFSLPERVEFGALPFETVGVTTLGSMIRIHLNPFWANSLNVNSSHRKMINMKQGVIDTDLGADGAPAVFSP